eukprot:1983551-Pyramimonas_sp.AAC.1
MVERGVWSRTRRAQDDVRRRAKQENANRHPESDTRAHSRPHETPPHKTSRKSSRTAPSVDK